MLRLSGTRLLMLLGCLGLFVSATITHAGEIDGKSFKDWVGQCEVAPDGREFCYILQRLQRKDSDGTLMITQVGYHLDTKEALVIFHLPPMLDQQEMLLFKTDDNDAKSISYSCNEQRCRGDFILDKGSLAELKKGRQGLVAFVHMENGKQVLLPLSLMGFTAGFKSLR
ncbi:invasion associated locus B family protein [Aliamphritea ceti]|uniref:invasion associated locus B family protein n=1 Tax=Aliamphritea ceti TaxID=1524258 RepID=UPI0021C466F8|nr:invasion associated locus B family protein [Aliamphritea ceti]